LLELSACYVAGFVWGAVSKCTTRIICNSQSYGQFLGAGDCFTAFAGALNAGLPVMFDREFGF